MALPSSRAWLWILIVALYVLLTIIATYPLAFKANDNLVAQTYNDSYYSVWIFGWEADALIRDPVHLFDAHIYYPQTNTLAFSEIILPEALMFLPLNLATGNPLFAYNLVLLLLFPLNALAMHAWIYYNLRDHRAAFLGGVLFAFATYKIGELRHIQLVAAQWMPLTFLFAQKFFKQPTPRNIFFTALFFLLNTLTSWYYALFLSLALGLYAAGMLLTRAWKINRQHLLLAGAGIIALVFVLLPFALPFAAVERDLHFSAERDPRTFAARPASYLATVQTNPIYTNLFQGLQPFLVSRGQPLFLGFIALALAALAFVTRPRDHLPIALMVLGAFALSFGPALIFSRDNNPVTRIPLPYAWISFLPGFKSLTAPARLAVVVLLGVSFLAASGAQVVAARVKWKNFAWGALIVLVGVEHFSAPLPLLAVPVGDSVPPVYRYLAQQPLDQPVVELPMGAPTLADQDRYGSYVYYQLYHRHPLLNGYSSFVPPPYASLAKTELGFPSRAAVDALRQQGAVWIVVHFKGAPAVWGTPTDVDNALDKQNHITIVEQFGDTWLYRLER